MSDMQPIIDDLRKQAGVATTTASSLRSQATGLDGVASALNADADKLAAMTPTPPNPTPGGATLGKQFGAFSMPLEQVQGVAQSFIDQQGDLLADLGVGWWRGDYPVSKFNPSKGQYVWPDCDRWVISALQRGIKPLPIIYMLGQWMNGSTNDKVPPTNNADYSTACVEAAKHLRGLGVTAIELWNEQNLSGFWANQPATDAAYRGKYVAMLKDAYPKIKAAVPDMIVIAGGLSTADTVFQSTGQPNPPGCGALSTIESYGQKGLFSACDAVAWHPYLDSDTPCKDVGNWPSWSPKAVAAALASIDKYAPGRGISIWSTEGGCPRSAVGGSAATQSQRAKDAYNAYMPGGCLNQYNARLGPYFWFCVIDRSTGDGREDSFGFVAKSGTKYQAYNDMKAAWAVKWG